MRASEIVSGTLAVDHTYLQRGGQHRPGAGILSSVGPTKSTLWTRSVRIERLKSLINMAAHVSQNKFVDYAKQRNYALDQLPIRSEWIFFLDADEWLPDELKHEISALIASCPRENGFYIKWRLIWMGRWIRRGYYPTWILRLFRYGKGRCEDRAVNEHLIVDGPIGPLAQRFHPRGQEGRDRLDR